MNPGTPALVCAFDLEFALQQGGFTLDVAIHVKGRALVLFGPSGSGKTTILEAIAGLRAPDRGRIAINGAMLVDTEGGVSLPPRERRVGYVPQDVLLFPHRDVRGNVLYGQRTQGRETTRDSHPPVALDHLVELLDLGPILDRRVESLSGGERQRVSIARALMADPHVLLLDEPLAAVDRTRRQRIAAALLRIRDELAVPIVYVTHALDEAIALADHAVVLDAGRVVASGPPGVVLLQGP